MNASNTKIKDIMTSNPRVGYEDDDVLDWLRTMSNDRFRRLPVVDENGSIKAIFTQGDFCFIYLARFNLSDVTND